MELKSLISKNWGFEKSEIIHSYNVSGGRVVCKLSTEYGEVIIKGIPIDVKEEIIIANTKSHEYLGNFKRLAPRIINLLDGSSYLKDKAHYYYMLEFISGRQLQETEEDEYLLGQAAANLHRLTDFKGSCSFHSENDIGVCETP